MHACHIHKKWALVENSNCKVFDTMSATPLEPGWRAVRYIPSRLFVRESVELLLELSGR